MDIPVILKIAVIAGSVLVVVVYAAFIFAACVSGAREDRALEKLLRLHQERRP